MMLKIIQDRYILGGFSMSASELAAVFSPVPEKPEGAVSVHYDGETLRQSDGFKGKTYQMTWAEADALIGARDVVIEDVLALRSIEDDPAQSEPPSLEDYLANYRYEFETSGFEFGGVNIQSDRFAQSQLVAARIKAKEDAEYSLKWKTLGGFVDMGSAQIIAIADAVHDHVQKCFQAEAVVYDDIVNGNIGIISEVEAAFSVAYASL